MDGVAATRAEPIVPTFGRYRIHELLGRGGMGTVHRAYDTEHLRTVALKRLPDSGIDERFRARFRREARIAAELHHPHAVPVHAFGEIDGQLYLDMMLVEGSDLRRLLGSGTLGTAGALAVLAQVASVLDAAHAGGIVHRDVKPSNILVDRVGYAYLADFGIARPTSPDVTDLTGSDGVLGTWDYLAPERLSGGPVDGRADQYSLACVLFECLTGRLPHPGGEAAAVVAGHLLHPPPAPSVFVATVTPELDAVVLRGMAKDPARRFPSCTALVDAAESALHDAATQAPAATTVDGPASGSGQEWLIRAVVRSGTRHRPATDAMPATCPYPGLRSFERADAAWFHGRGQVVTDILVRLAEQLPGGEPVVLIGASGSGKSSVLRAGVLPALHPGDVAGPDAGPELVCTPGADPIGALAAALAPHAGVPAAELAAAVRAAPSSFGELCRRAGGPGPARPVVVVDQFEELFSHDVPDADRLAFATALACASPALVLLAVRADLVERCIELTPLRPALAAPVLLGPLDEVDLRQAIAQPARDAGIEVEPGLPDRLIADLGVRADTGYDPADLPKLAHALRETWNEGGGALTLAAYRRAGGVDGAVARTAEQVYSELDDAGRDVARTVLLRLAIVPDAGPAVRRRVDRNVLDVLDGGSGVLDRLVAARLVTVDDAGARLSHEALLTAWPRLRDWIDLDRAGLVQHRRLAEASTAWREAGGHADDLYRGARLAALNAWLEAPGDGVRLDPVERDFLDRSNDADRAGLVSVRRRTRRLRGLVAALSTLLLVAAGAVVVAMNQRADAVDARSLSLSRQLATSSDLAVDLDPRRAALLALGGWQAAPTTEARSALLATATDPFRGVTTAAHDGAVTAVAMSGDATVAASGGVDGTLRLWDVRTRREVARLREGGGWYRSVSMSADGRQMISVDMRRGIAELWDVPGRRVRHTVPDHTVDVALSADGRTYAAVVEPGVVVVRDTTTFAEISRFPVGLSQRVVFSPDGALIATTNRNDVVVTRAADGSRVATLTGHTDAVTSIAFDRTGARLASTANDGTLRIWDTASGAGLRTIETAPGPAFVTAFRQDDRLLTGDSGSGIMSWDPGSGKGLGRAITAGRGTAALAVSGDGHTVLSGGLDGRLSVWVMGRSVLSFPDRAIIAIDPQPHGPLLAAVGGDGSGWLWDRQTGGRPRQLPEGTGRLRGATFSPDGTRLATVEDDGTLLVRDVATLAVTGRFSRPGTALAAVSFSPDGTRIAAAGSAGAEGADGGEVLLLDGADLALVQRLPTGSQPRNPQANATTDNAALGLAFSPDGTVLAVPLSAGRVTLWNLADPQAVPRSLEGHGALALDAAFTPDGTMLATAGGDRRVRLWSVPDGTPLGELESESAVRAVAFSPNGTVLAAASQDYLLRLWSMPDRRLLALLNRHSDELNDVAFDDEGRLISTGADGSAQVWDLDPDRAVATLCDRLDPAALSDDWRALGPDLGDPPRCPS